MTDYKHGIRKAPPAPASIVAAATAVTIWLLTAARTAKIKKLMIANRAGAVTQVTIGTGLAGLFVAAMPPIAVPNGVDLELTERDIPQIEFAANITAQASVAGAAPADVLVTPEVEEYE